MTLHGHDASPTRGLDWNDLAAIAHREAYKIVNCLEDAEDVTQDAMAVLVACHSRLQVPEAWVTTVAQNLAIDLLRRRQCEKGARDKAAFRVTSAVSDERSRVVESIALRYAIETLPERQKQAVQLFYLGDCDRKSVAEILQMSEETIKTHLQRGLDRLRSYFGDNDLRE